MRGAAAYDAKQTLSTQFCLASDIYVHNFSNIRCSSAKNLFNFSSLRLFLLKKLLRDVTNILREKKLARIEREQQIPYIVLPLKKFD